ncbi:type II toxin-antitoxin system antitoxin, RelB/DinJ family [Schaalia hyovaginalis]|nr:type II toxin-antitoxin system antitoxin, RelB/DinJ family [Schaalia hyovaginalis]MST63614.1 type II toxin-antitoxin system antitoxin, RelB/DinJ family [Schaalia hyovaginalis]
MKTFGTREGISTSRSSVMAFNRQIARESRIPLTQSDGEPNAESLAALEEAREVGTRGTSRFADADEMFEALGI